MAAVSLGSAPANILVFLSLVGLILGVSACSRDSTPTAYGQVNRDRLLAANAQPENWMTTGRDFGKSHYSPLTSIDRNSVGQLGLAWQYQTGTTRGLEATPIVVDGVMFTSGNEGRVYALNAKTGAEIWRFNPEVDGQIHRKACCDAVNRGVSVWRGRVYVAALDGRLLSLDAATGKVIWTADTIIDKVRAYTSTGAPEIAGDVVVIGNGGAEYDARGYISAYDLQTGNLAWRFFTVPGDPAKPYEHPELEMAAQTWDPHSRWDVGGGGTAWDAMVYDPELDLLYVGTGNAALYNQAERSPTRGDNLFLTSILAINPHTGRLVWYYQEVPGDMWDYTATQPIILTDLTIEGTTRKVLMQAPKDGFFYVLDRKTGELLSAKNYVPVTWASGVDMKTGRAQVNRDSADYATEAKLVFPANVGAHNWNPMAFSPQTGLVYIPVIEASVYHFDLTEGHVYRPGLRNEGTVRLFPNGLSLSLPDVPPKTKALLESGELLKGKPDIRMRALLRAWDPVQQKTVWEFESIGWWDRGGVLATAGGLVFQGSDTGHFRSYDAATGKLLKEIDTGTSIVAAPMTYAVDGEQYVAVMAAWGGGGWYVTHPESAAYQYGNAGRILVFKLGGGPTPKPTPLPDIQPIPEPPALTASAETIAHGAALFRASCTACHQHTPRTGSADLRRMLPSTHDNFKEIVLNGQRRARGMPQWDDVLSVEDADAIHAYLISISWEAYKQQQAKGR
jgi:quinohemoprotein ethanol dehydrogenase